jgi:hypothetical protein
LFNFIKKFKNKLVVLRAILRMILAPKKLKKMYSMK